MPRNSATPFSPRAGCRETQGSAFSLSLPAAWRGGDEALETLIHDPQAQEICITEMVLHEMHFLSSGGGIARVSG